MWDSKSRGSTFFSVASVWMSVWILSLKFHALHTPCKANVDIVLYQRKRHDWNGSRLSDRGELIFWRRDRSKNTIRGCFSWDLANTHTHPHTLRWSCSPSLMVFSSLAFPPSVKVIGFSSTGKYWLCFKLPVTLVDWHKDPLQGTFERHNCVKL